MAGMSSNFGSRKKMSFRKRPLTKMSFKKKCRLRIGPAFENVLYA
jgi:hypothetical protein